MYDILKKNTLNKLTNSLCRVKHFTSNNKKYIKNNLSEMCELNS